MPKHTICGLLLVLCLVLALTFARSAAAAGSTTNADFYVSTVGNDTWSGRLAEPASGGNDGPFSSLDRARLAVRDLRGNQPNRATTVTVYLREGIYYLKNTVRFLPADSGTSVSNTLYAAYPGEKPILSGGVDVTSSLSLTAEGYWQGRLPEVAAGKWDFIQLWVNGQRRFRPRYPNNNTWLFTRTDGKSTTGPATRGDDQFGFYQGDLNPDWTRLNAVELIFPLEYGEFRGRILSIENTTCTMTGPTGFNGWIHDIELGLPYFAENVYDELDSPGEWYLTTHTGTLTYIPYTTESLETATVIAPKLVTNNLQALIKVDPDVEYLVFDGLTFRHINHVIPYAGQENCASMENAGYALLLYRCHYVTVRNCEFSQLGANAIRLGIDCTYCTIHNCVFYDLGGGAIYGDNSGTNGFPSHITITNNLMAHGGRASPAGKGIYVRMLSDSVIRNNEVYDFYSAGINTGVGWDMTDSMNNDVSFNHVHHLGYYDQGFTNDFGGILVGAPCRMTTVSTNYVHDIGCREWGAVGIYFDGDAKLITLENNASFYCDSTPFQIGVGSNTTNTIQNNVFAFPLTRGDSNSTPFHTGSASGCIATRNIFVTNNGFLQYGTTWSMLVSGYYEHTNPHGAVDFSYNLYYSTAVPTEKWRWVNGSYGWSAWTRFGFDAHSWCGDPLFINTNVGDFRWASESPATSLGIQTIDFSNVGRKGSAVIFDPVPSAWPPKPRANGVIEKLPGVGPTEVLPRADTIPPTAVIFLDCERRVTKPEPLAFSVDFSEPIQVLARDQVTLIGSLAGHATFEIVNNSPYFTVVVNLHPPYPSGTVGLRVGNGVQDLAGNHFAGGDSPYQYQVEAAQQPELANEPTFTRGTTNTVQWSGVPLATEYYLEWGRNILFSPAVGNSGWKTGLSHTATGLQDGQVYYYRVKCRNAALMESVWSNVVSSRQDALAPATSVGQIPSNVRGIASLPIPWSGNDAGSGLAGVRLYYRWNSTGLFRQFGGEFTARPIVFPLTKQGDGVYEFYTVGRDNVGNLEEAPPVPDARVTVKGLNPAAPYWSPRPSEYTSGTAPVSPP